jgi:hypothetical protein
MYLMPNSDLAVSDASQLPRPRLRLGRIRRRRLLGQGGDETYITQAISAYQGQPYYQHMHDFVAGDLAAGVVDSGGNYATGAGVCAGHGPTVAPGQVIASVATSAAPKVFAAIAPVAAAGPIGAGIAIGAAVIGLFVTIFRPNQYTRDETGILCQAVPAANAVFQQVDLEVQYGTITPAQAIQALQTLVQQFDSAASKILGHTAGNFAQTGDNADFLLASVKAIAAKKTAQYQALQAPAAGGVAAPLATIENTISATAAQIGIPPTILWLVGGFLLFELV